MLAHALRPPALALLVAAFLAASLPAAARQVVRSGFVDPLSGAFANTGEHRLKHFQFTADEIDRRGSPEPFKVEIVGFDDRVSPQETLNQLKKIIDGGIRYVIPGRLGGRARARRRDQRHDERNPGKEILYLNYAAVDPDLTNRDAATGTSASTPTAT